MCEYESKLQNIKMDYELKILKLVEAPDQPSPETEKAKSLDELLTGLQASVKATEDKFVLIDQIRDLAIPEFKEQTKTSLDKLTIKYKSHDDIIVQIQTDIVELAKNDEQIQNDIRSIQRSGIGQHLKNQKPPNDQSEP